VPREGRGERKAAGGEEEGRKRERERERWRGSGCPPSRNETADSRASLPGLPLVPGRFLPSRLPPADADAVTVVTSN